MNARLKQTPAVEYEYNILSSSAGRAALLARGVNEVGPYQSPMEDGMQHFHEWYRRVMNFQGA